jgi:hypothetical protein
VQYVVSILFDSLCYFLITRLVISLIFLVCLFSCSVYLFSILYIMVFGNAVCTVSPFVYSRLFHIFVQVYRPLPSGGNPAAINKYHIIYVLPFLTLSSITLLTLTKDHIHTRSRSMFYASISFYAILKKLLLHNNIGNLDLIKL